MRLWNSGLLSLDSGLWVGQRGGEDKGWVARGTRSCSIDERNPADCSKARKLVCNINKGCGYGCQLHHGSDFSSITRGSQYSLSSSSSQAHDHMPPRR
ncbi:hypothetical protein CRUP_037430 [Coryphaenoides rupestris]|nr:hypothetical protein CRUP_037430 [Coryphaenoides rupestris]